MGECNRYTATSRDSVSFSLMEQAAELPLAPIILTDISRHGSLVWPSIWTSLYASRLLQHEYMKLCGGHSLDRHVHALHFTGFEVELCLWEAQLTAGHFVVHYLCPAACGSLTTSFSGRGICLPFTGVRPLAEDFKLFTTPLTCLLYTSDAADE